MQEEIRFVVSPECLLSLHFSECMADNEAIVIRGTERYSEYSGYARHFQFAGSFFDDTPCDEEGFRESYIVAYDALKFPLDNGSGEGGGLEQFREQNLLRELRKVSCRHSCICSSCFVFVAMEISILSIPCSAPSSIHTSDVCLFQCLVALQPLPGERRNSSTARPFATGNWGCGAFGGDPQLKSLLQWIAASVAARAVTYLPFGDARVRGLQEVVDAINSYNRSRLDSGCEQKFASGPQGLPDVLITAGTLAGWLDGCLITMIIAFVL